MIVVQCDKLCCIDVRMPSSAIHIPSSLNMSVPVAQWLEHCISNAMVVGSIPREHTY